MAQRMEIVQDAPSSNKVLQFNAERSPFFVRNGGKLEQVVFVHVELGERISKAELRITGANEVRTQNVGRLGKGVSKLEIYVPEVQCPTDFRIVLSWDSNEIGTSVKVLPEKHWTVHVIQHSHLDIGYTDPQPDILEYQMTYLDQVLELCDAEESDLDSRFKWVVEVTWPLKFWLESRPKNQVDKMIRRIREGRIEVAACYMNMHTEAYAIDELARTFETTQYLRDVYGIPIHTAIQSDVPGHTIGFLKCLADLKIKYFSAAHNYAGRSIPNLLPGEKLKRPFYWKSDNGESVLVWYTDTPHGVYMEGNRVGLADGYLEAFEKMPALFEQLREEDFPLDVLHLRVQGAYWDNAGPSIIPSHVVKEWNAKWAYPRLLISTNDKFFEQLEECTEIPTFSGDWTDWWADGIGSASYENGLNRKTHQLIRSAETMHSVIKMKDSSVPYPLSTLDDVYQNMVLFDEHTWGAAYPWENTISENTSGQVQWNIKRGFAYQAYNEATRELSRAKNLLTGFLDTTAGTGSTVVVYNTGTYPRTDIVTAFVPLGKFDVRQPFTLFDPETNEELPYEVKVGPDSAPRPRGGNVSFVAKDVPAFGFRTYLLKDTVNRGSYSENTSTGTASPQILENTYYRITIDSESGGISSIFDKELEREIVNQSSPFQMNQYIYDRYTTAPRFNHMSGKITGNADQFLGKRSTVRLAKVRKGESNRVYQSAKICLQAPGCEWLEQEVILYHEIKRIDVVNRMMKLPIEEKEAVYFSFPFEVPNGRLHYEITGDFTSPDAPHVPGSCHYMKAIQHWLSVSNENFTVLWGTLEAPLIEIGNISVPYNPFDLTLPVNEPQTVYSYASNNIWDTNFPHQQGGEMVFHFSITSHERTFNPVNAYRFGLEVQSPLNGIVIPQEVSQISDSWVSIDAENVQVIGIRYLEEQKFLVLLQEIVGQACEVELGFPQIPAFKAFSSNVVGGDLAALEVIDGKINFAMKKKSLMGIVVQTTGGPCK